MCYSIVHCKPSPIVVLACLHPNPRTALNPVNFRKHPKASRLGAVSRSPRGRLWLQQRRQSTEVARFLQKFVLNVQRVSDGDKSKFKAASKPARVHLQLHAILPGTCDQQGPAVRAIDPVNLLTSTQRQTAKKFFNSLLSFSGFFSVGVPFVAIKYKALSGSSSRYGGSFSIISIAMTLQGRQTSAKSLILIDSLPNDQMSTLAPYSFCLTTSGAIQYGVPTIVARLDFWSVSLAQKPKSADAEQTSA